MEFFKLRHDIPFMRHALVFNVISFLTFLAAIFLLWHKGLHFSIEFTGGTVMEVTYAQAANVDAIRDVLERAGYGEPQVQNFGSSTDVLVRLPLREGESTAKVSQTVMEHLTAQDASAELRRV